MHASLPLFCYFVVRHALRTVSEDNRVSADYVSALLLQFGLRERSRELRMYDDATCDTLSAISEAIEDGTAERSFLGRALGQRCLGDRGKGIGNSE